MQHLVRAVTVNAGDLVAGLESLLRELDGETLEEEKLVSSIKVPYPQAILHRQPDGGFFITVDIPLGITEPRREE